MTQESSKAKTAADHRLSFGWLGMVLLVVVVAVWKGPNNRHFWLWWEVSAILMATIYTILFYVRLGTQKDEADFHLYEGLKRWIFLVFPACVMAVVCLGVAMITSLEWWGVSDWISSRLRVVNTHMVPLLCLLGSGICFCVIDGIFWRKHKSQEIKREFKQAFLFNGLPVTGAFLGLLVFVSQYNVNANLDDALKSFVGGAIAFEMLLSNTMFAILFWNPHEI